MEATSLFPAFGRPLLRAAFALALVGGPAATPLPVLAQAATTSTPAQANYYRVQVGAVTVTTLSDSTVPLLVRDLLTNTPPAEVDQLLAHAHLAYPVETSINAYVLELGAAGARRHRRRSADGADPGPNLLPEN